MATIPLDDTTAGRTYVCQFIRSSDGYIWDGVSAWVAPNTLTDAELKAAIELVTSTSITNQSSTHIRYDVTVPAGITVPCHASAYLTSYAAGDAEDYGADYDPTDAAIKAKTDLIPASPAAVGSAMVVSDKTGFKLAADGLDQISATPVANPTTWAQRLNWVMQRFFYSAKTPDALVVKDANGDTLTTQALTDDAEGTETMGLPS
jgi:hypothetical protein